MGIGSRIASGFHSPQDRHESKVAAGDYFHSAERLFRVEDADDTQALVEDCMTGELIVIEVWRLLELEQVQREPVHQG